MFVCGSLAMGKDVMDVLEKWMNTHNMSADDTKKVIQDW